MKVEQIETLLLQEMEDVRGGTAGTCECEKGAGQATDSGGKCVCVSGAAQKLVTPTSPNDNPICTCDGGAGV